MTDKHKALEWFKFLRSYMKRSEYKGYLDLAVSALEKQEQDRWVPVSVRLPEKEGCYLVTVQNDHKRKYSKTAWYSGDGWFARQDIIAWRLTPEPYTEGEND